MAIRDIIDSILRFDDAGAARWVRNELDRGADAVTLLNRGLIAAMDEVGRQYEQGFFFVPEMLMAAQAMKSGVAVLRPHLENARVDACACVVIGTVHGDQHDIGKNLVALMLECAGFRVIDLGKNVGADEFADTARKNRADLVAMSALITSTLSSMETAVSRLKAAEDAPRILVGGAPVTQAFANRIGADGYSPDAVGAVSVARRLIGSGRRK
jgi:5-methyltetrahydrofolate--homocysteine methyltransferase